MTPASVVEKIARLPHGRTSFKQLVRELGAKGGQRDSLERMLARLAAKGTLIELRSGQYVLAAKTREYAVGRLNVHRDGYGFVVSDHPIEGLKGDVYLPREEAGKAMHGDRVVVRLGHIGGDGRAEGAVYDILERAHRTVVGEFLVRRQGNLVKPFEERIQQWIEVPDGMEVPPARETVDRVGVTPRAISGPEDMDGMVVNVELLEWPDEGDHAVGRVIEILGRPDDFGVDVEITIRKHHLPHEFPPDVLREARAMSPELDLEELARRRDFRDLAIVTIDGETARDFDDAVWVERLPDGTHELQVHIADVGHYVRPGSAIDREAANRGTSVYFPDRAIPMLPVELSTDLCSLKPQVDRPVLSAILRIDAQGDVIAQEFTRGVIRSAARMTYTKVHRILEGKGPEDDALRAEYAALVPRFEQMRDLATVLMRKRDRRGSIDFDLPEPVIEFGDEGEMVGVTRHPRNIAHRLIEEFMLAANEAVASHLEAQALPLVFRIHEPPSAQKVQEFEETASHFGHSLGVAGATVKKFAQVTRTRDGRKLRRDVTVPHQGFEISPRLYQKLIRKLEGRPEGHIVNYLMLRSLKQARYAADNHGHFALAAPSYAHFTSPIRRFPDLLVHRALGAWLDHAEPPYPREELGLMADDASLTERRAAEAERELVEWKKIKFMADKLGEEFAAMVKSTTRFGLFVELETLYVEGLVPIDTLPGDRYFYNESTRKIMSERGRQAFSIGDRVQVVLDRVDAVEKRLQFSIVESSGRGRRGKNRV